ncbi:DegV family protein [Mumia sp. zg.B53]|uniref:DegV family protein n=1 Tax=unclassified Mumia TaxID=2621872 RepID=UPI001C6F48A4|nr:MULTISPECIES: DegV family protein [unclassified Mumia]MBW9211255.1 DegV family protein [Mumia sp. zg.B21]MBW9215830.1 DegV family protein [Mumia sp. zg.B53]MDD9347826.1 DegV family protein [Mumia sp.]
MTLAIVTDSTASLSVDIASARDVTVVPLEVVVDGRSYTEGLDVTSADLARALRAGRAVGTSRPAPERFSRVYAGLAERGAEAIVSVHLSSRVSATLESAQLAAQDCTVPVTCVDSLQVGMATGYAVLTAADARDAGKSADDVAKAARDRSERATTYFYVATLDYLRRGGRIGTASALLGSALSVKPILGVKDGRVRPIEKVRTSTRAIARLEELTAQAVASHGDEVDVAVQHLDADAQARALAERLGESLGRESIDVMEVGAVIGAHVGPGLLAVTVSARMPSLG